MEKVVETSRRKAPFEKPQSVAFDGTSLWIGSIATNKVYQLNPQTLAVSHQFDAPGKPWGIADAGNDLLVICGEGSDDDRYVRRLSSERGFAGGDGFRCPDGTGSQLSFDGKKLFISQWYNRRILGVDDRGNVTETIDVPHQICGQTYADDGFYLLRRKTKVRPITGSPASHSPAPRRRSKTLRTCRLRHGHSHLTAFSFGRITAKQ